MRNIILILLVLSLSSCQMAKNFGRRVISSTVGITRDITLYSVNGTVIETWRTKSSINDEGSVICFYDNEGEAVQISGTVIVQQIK